jgi:hypothetical protein
MFIIGTLAAGIILVAVGYFAFIGVYETARWVSLRLQDIHLLWNR